MQAETQPLAKGQKLANFQPFEHSGQLYVLATLSSDIRVYILGQGNQFQPLCAFRLRAQTEAQDAPAAIEYLCLKQVKDSLYLILIYPDHGEVCQLKICQDGQIRIELAVRISEFTKAHYPRSFKPCKNSLLAYYFSEDSGQRNFHMGMLTLELSDSVPGREGQPAASYKELVFTCQIGAFTDYFVPDDRTLLYIQGMQLKRAAINMQSQLVVDEGVVYESKLDLDKILYKQNSSLLILSKGKQLISIQMESTPAKCVGKKALKDKFVQIFTQAPTKAHAEYIIILDQQSILQTNLHVKELKIDYFKAAKDQELGLLANFDTKKIHLVNPVDANKICLQTFAIV